MQRRDFTKHVAAGGLGWALAATARAQTAPVEGTHYVRLNTPAPVTLPAGKKIDVVEFFSYGCPHCATLEPLLEAWVAKLPADVSYRPVPVGFSGAFQTYQKMFFALEDLGQLPALHRKVFIAIHQQGRRLLTESDQVAFMNANGVDGAKFVDAMKSFSVTTKGNRARQLADAYKIDGVPAIGVHGRYYTAASLAGSHERSLAVADYLIQRARQGA